MYKPKLTKTLLFSIICLAGLSIVGCKKHEHPSEHPEESGPKISITKDELADAVEEYVNKQAAQHDGFFLALDEKTGQQLKLNLDKVHRERLSKVGPQTYFACADFKTPEGKIYDLDVFMTGSDKNSLTFSEFSIHKEQGKERYTWYEQNGIWKKKAVEAVVKKQTEIPKKPDKEHPEHPK